MASYFHLNWTKTSYDLNWSNVPAWNLGLIQSFNDKIIFLKLVTTKLNNFYFIRQKNNSFFLLWHVFIFPKLFTYIFLLENLLNIIKLNRRTHACNFLKFVFFLQNCLWDLTQHFLIYQFLLSTLSTSLHFCIFVQSSIFLLLCHFCKIRWHF